MAAATADTTRKQRKGDLEHLPVNGGATLYTGTLICTNGDGDAVDGADTAGLLFAGVGRQAVDNSAGADGDLNVEVWQRGSFQFTSAGLTDANVGDKVYIVDNQTVGLKDDAGVDNHVYVGRITRVVSATSCWVAIDPLNAPEVRQFTVEAPGVNAAAFDLSAQAAAFGGADFIVDAVQNARSWTTATNAVTAPHRRVITTDWTLTSGVLSAVGDETPNTWAFTFTGRLV